MISCYNYDNDNNDNGLITVKTNRSTIHTLYNIQQSATQGSNDKTQTVTQGSSNNQVKPRRYRLPETDGAKVLPTSNQVGLYLTRWRHLSTHPINRPTTLFIFRYFADDESLLSIWISYFLDTDNRFDDDPPNVCNTRNVWRLHRQPSLAPSQIVFDHCMHKHVTQKSLSVFGFVSSFASSVHSQ